MNAEIKLDSRGIDNNRLIQIEGQPLRFRLNTDYAYRIGLEVEDSEKCVFIDPSGGPFITAGSIIDGHKVKAVYKEGIVEFEP